MSAEKRKEQWRNCRNKKMGQMTPQELEVFRARKAEYDMVYRREQRAKREAYRKDPVNMEKARIAANLRYHAKVDGKPKRIPFTEEEKRVRSKAQEKKPHRIQKQRENRRKNRDKINKAWNVAYHKNPRLFLERNKAYAAKRKKIDPLYRLICGMRSLITSVLRGKLKSKHSMELIGCSSGELKAHLESQFRDGMSWDNYGRTGWHVDHRTPCSHFSLADSEEQKKCFHWSNLQPMYGSENSRKGNRYVSPPIGQLEILKIVKSTLPIP